jgi:tetratricopeptide (TPR) repeat protein
MDSLSGIGEQLFSVLGNRFSTLSGLSGTSLARGIDHYQKGDYEGAIREFRRAISLDPYSDNSLKAYDFIAQAYMKLKRPEDAKKVYKEAMRLFPQEDSLYLKLGNLYYDESDYQKAEAEYLKAVRIAPSPENLYPLGQVYLSTKRYKEAEEVFQRILRHEPGNYGALYSLGKVYAEMGLFSEAIEKFKGAIEIKRDFAYVYYDLGAVYARIGEFDRAQEQIKILEGLNKELSIELKAYIYRIKRPAMEFVRTPFNMKKGPGTPLSSLDPVFLNPDASKDFSIVFYFDKEMDRSSVENVFNWSISRTYDIYHGGPYNWGLPLPETEVNIYPIPKMVIYNSDTRSATVYFTLKQNSSADGTIDPSHIVFRFYGKDTYGNTIDPAKDEYTGLSLIV